MRKLVAVLFASGMLAIAIVVPTASASQSRHSCDGVFSTALQAHGASDYDPGQAWHACGG
jgi:hypothetical protein